MKKVFKKIFIFPIKLIFGKKASLYKVLYNDESDNLFYNRNQFFNSITGVNTKLYPPFRLNNTEVGNYTYISENSKIQNTKIGKFCSIGPNLICGWGIHPINGISSHPMFYSTLKQNGMTLSESDKFEEIKSIEIGNDVFIGMNVSILDGVKIGDGAVIGAGAVVSKDIPPYAIAIGSPISIKGYRFDNETIEKILKLKWWDFENYKLKEIEQNFYNVENWLKNHAL